MELVLKARPPFSLAHVIHSHGWMQLAPFVSDEPYNVLVYTDRLSSRRVIALDIHQAGDSVCIVVENGLDQAEVDEITAHVTWMLGLDQDLSGFYARARVEPKLAHVEKNGQGRVLRSATLFEDVTKTILTTNTLWAATIRMNNTLVDLYGEPLASDPRRHAFPTPHQLAMLDEETLRTQARLGYRAPYVLELAQRCASGELDLEGLKHADLPTGELRKRLLAIKGVGDYAAANLLMLLGRYDYLPVDTWALKVVSHEWYNGEPVGRKEVEEAFEAWGEWKGLAYWFWAWSYHG